MARLNIRQGMVGGGVVAVMSASGAAGQSADPLPTFASTLVFALACAGAVIGFLVIVDRSSKSPPRW